MTSVGGAKPEALPAWLIVNLTWPSGAPKSLCGGVLAEALPESDAATVIDAFVAVTSWEALTAAVRARLPDQNELQLIPDSAPERQFMKMRSETLAARIVLTNFGRGSP